MLVRTLDSNIEVVLVVSPKRIHVSDIRRSDFYCPVVDIDNDRNTSNTTYTGTRFSCSPRGKKVRRNKIVKVHGVVENSTGFYRET